MYGVESLEGRSICLINGDDVYGISDMNRFGQRFWYCLK